MKRATTANLNMLHPSHSSHTGTARLPAGGAGGSGVTRARLTRYPMQLRPFRRRAGLTVRAAAERLGINPSTYSRIENGAQFPGGLLERRISHLYQLTDREHDLAFGFPGGAPDNEQEVVGGARLGVVTSIGAARELRRSPR